MYEVRARKGNREAIAALRTPPLPDRFRYLLDWFAELSGRRGEGAIGWRDLDAWASRMGVDPTPWECRVLGLIDDAYLRTQSPSETPSAGTVVDVPAWPSRKTEFV